MGMAKWKVCSTIGVAQKPRTKDVPARRMDLVLEEIARAKARFGLPAEATVHGWLSLESGVRSVTVQVGHAARAAITAAASAAPRGLFFEDARQLHRELKTLQGERTEHINRIKGLLIGVGIEVAAVTGRFPEELAELRLTWKTETDPQGAPLPAGLRERLRREYERLALVERQISELEGQRAEAIGGSEGAAVEKVRELMNLHGIGETSAWTLVMEFFGWRSFRNGREVGSLSGLAPTPYDSGGSERSQGISKAGNPRIRALMIELGWGWRHWQKRSELSRWYDERFWGGSKRQRKIGIVALARKLIVALWRYVETGVAPKGALVVDWRNKIPKSLQKELESPPPAEKVA
jgi:transposase